VPLELRKILFSAAELKAAVVEHCRATDKPLPDTDIARLVIRKDQRAAVTLHFRPSFNPADPAEVAFSGADVLEALIRHCAALGIPLPRAAKKVLWAQEDGMALLITLQTTADLSAAALRGRRSA
jgi:hypothetical protein